MGIKAGKWGETLTKAEKSLDKDLGKGKLPGDVAKALKVGEKLRAHLAQAYKYAIIFSMAKGSNKEEFLEPYTKTVKESIALHKTFRAIA